jgi:hypothetical protein
MLKGVKHSFFVVNIQPNLSWITVFANIIHKYHIHILRKKDQELFFIWV